MFPCTNLCQPLRAWFKQFICIAAMLLCLSVVATAQFRSPQTSNNDPTVVRPQGFSIQQPNTQNQMPAQPMVEPNGQRVFAQPPNVNAVAARALASKSTNEGSAVQPASFASDVLPSKSKSRIPLELKSSQKENSGSLDKPKSAWSATLSMFLSLAVVISFFLLIVWLIKKSQPHAFVKLPGEVVQVMGRTPMAPRQQMYVVRFGSKLLLISHQPGQTQTLCEIDNLDEVQRLAGLCEANQPGSISNSFRDVLKQVALGTPDPELSTAKRFARR